MDQEIKALEDRIRSKDEAITDLVEERDRYKDAFAQQALSRASPAPESSKKSSKIADPPILIDGKDLTFENWLSLIQDKLAANADHYPTPTMRLAYIKSRCGGRAAEHLMTRSRDEAPNKYKDATDVIDHLKTIYQDVNRVITAKAKFRQLYMKPSDRFQEFLSDFSYYAQESSLAESEWKEELYQRISTNMQRQLMRESNDTGLDFSGFAAECTRVANRLEQISLRDQRGRNQGNINSGRASNREATSTGQRGGSTLANTTVTSQTAKPPGGLTAEARAQLMKEGKCFNCKERGHLSRDCPHKKKAAELKALEQNSLTNNMVAEDSEKDQA